MEGDATKTVDLVLRKVPFSACRYGHGDFKEC